MDDFRDFEAAGWEEVAPSYSASSVVGSITGEVAEILAAEVRSAPGCTVLDLACGPGLAARASRTMGASVIGVDIAETMADIARKRVPDAEFRVSPAEHLPFEDNSFDGVMCGFGLPHFADPEAVFSETRRVLGSDGRLAFTTWCSPDKVPFFGLIFEAVVTHGDLDVPLPDGPDMFRFADPDESERVLTALGFTDIGTRELPLVARTDDASQAIELVSKATVRTRALFDAQTEEAKAAITSAVTESVESMQSGKTYEVPMPAVLITASSP